MVYYGALTFLCNLCLRLDGGKAVGIESLKGVVVTPYFEIEGLEAAVAQPGRASG